MQLVLVQLNLFHILLLIVLFLAVSVQQSIINHNSFFHRAPVLWNKLVKTKEILSFPALKSVLLSSL